MLTESTGETPERGMLNMTDEKEIKIKIYLQKLK